MQASWKVLQLALGCSGHSPRNWVIGVSPLNRRNTGALCHAPRSMRCQHSHATLDVPIGLSRPHAPKMVGMEPAGGLLIKPNMG